MVRYRFLADVVVIAHLAFVAFVILALLCIVIGAWFGWQWVRNLWFRLIHVGMVAVVVIQSILGIACPLTTLEKHLRLRADEAVYPGSFLGHWAHELLFFDAPPWVFTVIYCLFGSLVLVSLFVAPPRWVFSRSCPS